MRASDEPQVAVVADQVSVRDRLRAALEGAGLSCRMEAPSIGSLSREPVLEQVDVIVLRPSGARRDALQGFTAARAAFPERAIVGVWPGLRVAEASRALRSGVDALLGDEQIERALAVAVAAAHAGSVCIPQAGAGVEPRTLSNRERQVLGLLVTGLGNRAIGRRLGLTESTVKSHLSSAYAKLGVRSRKDAAARILDADGPLREDILGR